MTHEELRDRARSLPRTPGVYLMKNRAGEIIYVGKAKALRNRVSQYFNGDHEIKTRTMVSQVDTFDVILVKSEFDALVLECNLIKQHLPKYNILLKDGKGFPYLRLTGKAKYPRFSISGSRGRDGASYFGPYGSRGECKAIIDALSKTFRLPQCSRVFPRDIGKARPCLHFHMGNCEGWCQKADGETDYGAAIRQAVLLLEGRQSDLETQLTQEMEEAADALRFEQAARLRDRRRAIEHLRKRQQLVSGVMADTDAVGFYQEGERACLVLSHFISGTLLGQDKEFFTLPIESRPAEVISSVLGQYYLRRERLPRRILLPMELEDDLASLFTQRAGYVVKLQTPQRGEQAERVKIACENAKELLRQSLTKEERERAVLTALGKQLSLAAPPRRIEAYDISNTGASDIVSVMTVFEDGRPRKRAYRQFIIKGQQVPDDYKAMEETITRRVERFLAGDAAFSPLPDVMLIDGGQTHAAVAQRVLMAYGLSVPVFGMVKDDRHRTRALLSPTGQEIGLLGNQSLFSFVGRIQDETHNSAVAFHHKRRSKNSGASVLDEIPGVGPARKAALFRAFQSVKQMRAASREALMQAVPKHTAEAVYAFFHPGDGEADETKE